MCASARAVRIAALPCLHTGLITVQTVRVTTVTSPTSCSTHISSRHLSCCDSSLLCPTFKHTHTNLSVSSRQTLSSLIHLNGPVICKHTRLLYNSGSGRTGSLLFSISRKQEGCVGFFISKADFILRLKENLSWRWYDSICNFSMQFLFYCRCLLFGLNLNLYIFTNNSKIIRSEKYCIQYLYSGVQKSETISKDVHILN